MADLETEVVVVTFSAVDVALKFDRQGKVIEAIAAATGRDPMLVTEREANVARGLRDTDFYGGRRNFYESLKG